MAASMLLLLSAAFQPSTGSLNATAPPQLRVLLPKGASAVARGRVRLYIATSCDPPPRTQCSDSQDTAQVFGLNTPEKGLKPGQSIDIDVNVLGYPRHSLQDLPAREFCAQAELFPHRIYQRGDGVNLTLPVSCVSRSGQDGSYDTPAGTLFSDAQRVHFGAALPDVATFELTHMVQDKNPPGCSGHGADTDWIKTVKVHSRLLSAFWGVPLNLEACVLLPYGFDKHPTATYPLVIAHGHFSDVFVPGGRFDPSPPQPGQSGYAYIDQLYAYYLYRNWTSPTGPFRGARALVVSIKHPVPFFDDSYAVDSVNVGPYGSAIMTELLPAIEKKYRGIGQGWARGLLGGSTGGWEAFAVQVLYPTEFNYAAVACPDPVSFSSYATVDIYSEPNAYYYESAFKRTARPGVRDGYSGTSVVPGTHSPTYGHPYGQTTATVEEMNRREIVLGEHSSSCGQWDIWEAVFGPRGDDGYPARIWCKDPRPSAECEYGAINRSVAAYWRENYDMLHILKRRWASGLGAKLSGKLHVFVGGSDTFYLNNAVMDLQSWALNETLSPPFGGEIVIGTHDGRGYEHCFNGYLPDGSRAPNAITRELYLTKFLPRMAERWAATAPKDADMEWRSY